VELKTQAELLRKGRNRARAFTLIEAVVVVIIIALVASIVLIALSASVKGSRLAAERQELRALTTAVQQFKTTFGFLPPLLDDNASSTTGPVVSGKLVVRPDRFLSGELLPDEPRYSVYSLPYFVMGLGDVPGAGGRPIDGAAGPRLTKPNPDGSFAMAGQVYESFSAMGSKDATRVVRDSAEQARIVAVDRWGRGTTFNGPTPPANSLRFYRWKPQYFPTAPGQPATLDQYMVPRAVGDPNENTALRNAEFAIVSVGPDGLTDTDNPLPRANTSNPATSATPINVSVTKDDIVEVGG
jgi:type II secretory pathway pseudopilin PulG